MHRARTLASLSRVSAHKAAHSAKESAPPDSPTHTTSGYPKSSRLRRTATRTCRKCGDFRGQKGALYTFLVLPQHTRHGVLSLTSTSDIAIINQEGKGIHGPGFAQGGST